MKILRHWGVQDVDFWNQDASKLGSFIKLKVDHQRAAAEFLFANDNDGGGHW